MKNSSPSLKFINFVDDTTVYSVGSNMNEMYDVQAAELLRVGKWLHANRLSLNIDKISYMIVTNRKFDEMELALSGKIIQKTNSIKLLHYMRSNFSAGFQNKALSNKNQNYKFSENKLF